MWETRVQACVIGQVQHGLKVTVTLLGRNLYVMVELLPEGIDEILLADHWDLFLSNGFVVVTEQGLDIHPVARKVLHQLRAGWVVRVNTDGAFDRQRRGNRQRKVPGSAFGCIHDLHQFSELKLGKFSNSLFQIHPGEGVG